MLRKSQCARNLENNLDELEKRSEIESLRYHIANESCFPPMKDPQTTPITFEELKKLARAWKLHERRNF